MTIFTKIINAIFLTLILSIAIFANSNNDFQTENFSGSKVNTVKSNKANIPYFVLDKNFRSWQPHQQVQLIPSYARNDTAWTNGYVIFYNPAIVSQTPAKVAAFVLAHEYGHIYQRTSNEFASDAFAARIYAQTDKSVCQAVVWWMINFPNGSDATHLPSPVRAQNIARECGLR